MKLGYINQHAAYRGHMGAYSKTVVDGLNQTMDNVVNSLNRAISSVRSQITLQKAVDLSPIATGLLATVAPIFALVGAAAAAATSTDEAKAAVLSGLNTMSNIVNRLNTTSRAEVIAGTMPTQKWMASAEEVRKGIQAQAKILKDETTWNLVEETITNAYRDFASLGHSASNFFEKYKWPLLIGGGGILAFALYAAVAPKRLKVSVNPMSWFDPEQRDLEEY